MSKTPNKTVDIVWRLLENMPHYKSKETQLIENYSDLVREMLFSQGINVKFFYSYVNGEITEVCIEVWDRDMRECE